MKPRFNGSLEGDAQMSQLSWLLTLTPTILIGAFAGAAQTAPANTNSISVDSYRSLSADMFDPVAARCRRFIALRPYFDREKVHRYQDRKDRTGGPHPESIIQHDRALVIGGWGSDDAVAQFELAALATTESARELRRRHGVPSR